MKIELGKRYVRRDGKITGALVQHGNGESFATDPNCEVGFVHVIGSDNGICLLGQTRPQDLISEYTEEAE